jgi:LPPG:FO 2-phospho-L-lactate transferase
LSTLQVVVLAGGVGAARFLEGLVQVVPPDQITAIVNTGDDADFYGLRVCPDLDTVIYTLAGLVNPTTGWGIAGDTFACLDQLGTLGADTWFRLGDRDLATHLRRTTLLQSGASLSEATQLLCATLGVPVRLLPMTNESVRTIVETPDGHLPFQDYFVRRGQQDDVRGISFAGILDARPAPGVVDAIQGADAIILAPSNPFVSIAPILAVDGIRDALRRRRAHVAAVTPIIGGTAVKGPADHMLRTLGHDVSAVGVARHYREDIATFVLDAVDSSLTASIEQLGLRVVVAPTLMTGPIEKRALAERALEAALSTPAVVT